MQLSPSNPIGKIRFKTWKVRGKPSPDGQPRLAVPHPLGLDAPATPPDEERGCRWALAAGGRRRQGSRVCFDRAAHSVRLSWRCDRSEEHTSELQSLMRISYAGFCLKQKTTL